mgnify:CR=1 FL=1
MHEPRDEARLAREDAHSTRESSMQSVLRAIVLPWRKRRHATLFLQARRRRATSDPDGLALALANAPHVSVVGGAEIYRLFLPRADRIELTEVHLSPLGDTVLEPFGAEWAETARISQPVENGAPAHDFVTLKRRR